MKEVLDDPGNKHLCATDVVAQDAKQEDAGAVIDETYTLICLQCNVKQPTSYEVHGDNLTEEDIKKGIYVKYIYLCSRCLRFYKHSISVSVTIHFLNSYFL